MAAFPGSLASFAGFTAGHTLAADSHAAQHNLEQGEVLAVQTKVGTGASTPTSGTFLKGNGVGSSAWTSLTSADISDISSKIFTAVFPVGSIYIETTGTNPGTTLGFGTWVAYGGGQTLIGVGTSDQAFAAGATGGESNHTLTSSEMPSHTHTQDAHTHTTTLPANSTAGGTGNFFAGNNGGSLVAPSSSTTATNQNTGGGASHNNLQPYIVTYFWKRTA